MRTFEFHPTTEGFQGKIVLRLPTYAERLGMVADMGLSFDADGGFDLAKAENPLGQFAKMIQKVPEYIEAVDLWYGEQQISSYDDLQYYNEGVAVINEIVAALAQGMSLGKNY